MLKRLLLYFAIVINLIGITFGKDLDMAEKLSRLKPLQKVHYYWASERFLKNRESRLLYHTARLTHSVCIKGEWDDINLIDNALYTCARINKTEPDIKCRIGVNLSPYHNRFSNELPPTDRGSDYHAELRFLRKRLEFIKKSIIELNGKYSSKVEVGAFLLDCEQFKAVDDINSAHNKAMAECLDVAQNLCLSYFPEARIEWFGRGIQREWNGEGWGRMKYFTGKEMITSLSCSFYALPEIERMRETFRRTSKLAEEIGTSKVTPWVALASGFRRTIENPQKWDFNWDYDLIYSYLIGRELNNDWYSKHPVRFAPYDKAEVIIFYPAPFDRRCPNWGRHFIAFCRGASGEKELSDLNNLGR